MIHKLYCKREECSWSGDEKTCVIDGDKKDGTLWYSCPRCGQPVYTQQELDYELNHEIWSKNE